MRTVQSLHEEVAKWCVRAVLKSRAQRGLLGISRGGALANATRVSNYEWDRLIWILYDREFKMLEAWERAADAYRSAFHTVERDPEFECGGRR